MINEQDVAAVAAKKASRTYNHCRNPECRARVPKHAGAALCPSCLWIQRKATRVGMLLAGPIGAIVGGLIAGFTF